MYKWQEEAIKEIEKMGHYPERIAYFKEQYVSQGFADCDLWNLDHSFAKWMLPRLKAFKEVNVGYPPGITAKRWNQIIDDMIAGFEVMADETLNYSLDRKHNKAAKKAMRLFGMWGRNLWS